MFTERFSIPANRNGWPDAPKAWWGPIKILGSSESATAKLWINPPRDGIAETTPVGTLVHSEPELGEWGVEVSGVLLPDAMITSGRMPDLCRNFSISLILPSGSRCAVLMERLSVQRQTREFTASCVGLGLPPAEF